MQDSRNCAPCQNSTLCDFPDEVILDLTGFGVFEYLRPGLFAGEGCSTLDLVLITQSRLLIRRHAGLHPDVYFADFKFPKAAYFRSGHISFLYPGEYRITAGRDIRKSFSLSTSVRWSVPLKCPHFQAVSDSYNYTI